LIGLRRRNFRFRETFNPENNFSTRELLMSMTDGEAAVKI